jgi:hypothetical protein
MMLLIATTAILSCKAAVSDSGVRKLGLASSCNAEGVTYVFTGGRRLPICRFKVSFVRNKLLRITIIMDSGAQYFVESKFVVSKEPLENVRASREMLNKPVASISGTGMQWKAPLPLILARLRALSGIGPAEIVDLLCPTSTGRSAYRFELDIVSDSITKMVDKDGGLELIFIRGKGLTQLIGHTHEGAAVADITSMELAWELE